MYIHTFPVRVYYEDTDMGGIVYYANYLRFIERARSDWVRQIGVDQNAMRDQGLIFVVRRVEADYIAPAIYEDELVIETTIDKLTGVRMVFRQVVLKGEKKLFEALVTAVCLDASGKVTRLAPEIQLLNQ